MWSFPFASITHTLKKKIKKLKKYNKTKKHSVFFSFSQPISSLTRFSLLPISSTKHPKLIRKMVFEICKNSKTENLLLLLLFFFVKLTSPKQLLPFHFKWIPIALRSCTLPNECHSFPPDLLSLCPSFHLKVFSTKDPGRWIDSEEV